MASPPTSDEVRKAFAFYDPEARGRIGVAELERALCNPAGGAAFSTAEARTFAKRIVAQVSDAT